MSAEHTASCVEARVGHIDVETGKDDEYPYMGRLSKLEQEAVLSCPSAEHDVVRLWWGATA